MDGRRIDDEAAWAAVLARDPSADGSFVYAVRSTRVYCRPSCPSRRPRRDRVAFFPGPEQAEAAGFRACRRCRPHEAVSDAERRALQAARILEERAGETLTLAALAAEVALSPGHLQRTFTRLLGQSPKRYQTAVRLERLRQGLREGEPLAQAAFGAGFGSSRGLYEQAEGGMGMTPGAYHRGAEGLTIRYTVVESPLGQMLVATTAKGVCAVMLGDDPRRLADELRREFSKAQLVLDDDVRGHAEDVVARLGDPVALEAVPLDLRGTEFQRRVWAELRKIPAGETVSYAEVARRVGRPKAVRAVASACGDNHVAVLVPCHRVVRSDGGLGGYKWGLARKEALLETEGARGGSEGAAG